MIGNDGIVVVQFLRLPIHLPNLDLRITYWTESLLFHTIPNTKMPSYTFTAEIVMTWSECDCILVEFMTGWALE